MWCKNTSDSLKHSLHFQALFPLHNSSPLSDARCRSRHARARMLDGWPNMLSDSISMHEKLLEEEEIDRLGTHQTPLINELHSQCTLSIVPLARSSLKWGNHKFRQITWCISLIPSSENWTENRYSLVLSLAPKNTILVCFVAMYRAWNKGLYVLGNV